MNCTSFINTSACSGVLVRARRTWHVSRSGASKVDIDGGGEVRFQNVYMLRRYSFRPVSCLNTDVLLPPKPTGFQSPAGWYGSHALAADLVDQQSADRQRLSRE